MLETLGLESKSIIKELDEIFPPINPSPDDQLSTIMFRSGQRSVVEWIQQRLDSYETT